MANVKITELTALTDPASTDVLPIVDVVADVTKKISIADLLENAGSGTAAAPGIAFDGDSNTGIYRPGADQVAFATNGTGRLFIDSAGNVGIGTSSPGSRLEVSRLGAAWTGAAASSAAAVFIHNGNNLTTGSAALQISGGSTSSSVVYFGDESNADAGSIQYGHGSDSMLFRVNAAERMRIDASGNVGIGTSSPDAKLKVQPVGSDIPQSAFGIRQNNAADTTQTTLDVEIDPVNSTARILSNATSSPRIGLYTSNQLALYIDESQLVGIGTSSPDYKLHVNQSISSGFERVAELAHGADPNFKLVTANGSSTNSAGEVASRFGIYYEGTGWDTYINYIRGSLQQVGSIAFNTADAERMRIDSAGRLLVGTSSQSGGSLLQVNDDRIRIASSKTPASASDTGTAGEICWDSSYIYVCTATDTWKRAALSTW